MLYISQEKNCGHISSYNMRGSKLLVTPRIFTNETESRLTRTEPTITEHNTRRQKNRTLALVTPKLRAQLRYPRLSLAVYSGATR